ncbi:SCF ubiquitin ligase complex subunit [Puccinia graminis f. sp. tritici]|uniref:SCF ubiquitin ligase complex subunit n=1 Tax=Puccinia graminis f. sp. tritici TaxID=56615 RepID=A0A5B0RUR6_PUCGR|nr:SCF ubiquitin ligase complex subunit [Puccinia graminis f. sp. tritici]
MAAAMAATRQQTNPQLYGMGSCRRELQLPERGGRVALSDFLHQGPSTSVNSAVISGNGQQVHCAPAMTESVLLDVEGAQLNGQG